MMIRFAADSLFRHRAARMLPLVALIASAAMAQPVSFGHADHIGATTAELPSVIAGEHVDVEALLRDDATRHAATSHRPTTRFATPVLLNRGLDAGLEEYLADGSRLWRLRVELSGARSISLAFDAVDLAPGARLWLHSPDRSQVRGPFTREAVRHGRLWTPMLLGDTAIVELHEPADQAGTSRLLVWRGHYGYRGPGLVARKQGACNIDVICSQGDAWRDQIRSVAMYSLNGTDFCSGVLINNARQDGRPLFLTADHCQRSPGFEGFPGMVVYWNYQSPTCGALSGGDKLAQSTAGSTLLAFDTTTDFAILELAAPPEEAFGAYFAGWDTSPEAAPSAVGIHHPSTDEKAISFEDDPVISVTEIDPNLESHWRVTDWDAGTTEPGSSGSPLFSTENKLVIGTLTGGTAACGNNLPDFYGKLSEQMNRGLSAILDPDGTGVSSVDGADAAVLFPIFGDGFELGHLDAWSSHVP